jgi:hypothetical protein
LILGTDLALSIIATRQKAEANQEAEAIQKQNSKEKGDYHE